MEEVGTALHASEVRSSIVLQVDDRLGDHSGGMVVEHGQTPHVGCTLEAELQVRGMPLGTIL